MFFLLYRNKKMIIFFKKKILDKAVLRYYFCNENYKTKFIERRCCLWMCCDF